MAQPETAALQLILTRPQQQAGEWLQRLQAQGVPARSFPLLAISPAEPAQVQAAWAALPRARLAFFVSPNAVEGFFAQAPTGFEWPAACLAACVGPGSARALQAAGVPVSNIIQPPADAPSLDSEHLWPQLSGMDWQGQPVLMLRGEGGRDWLAERLRERGAAPIEFFSVYRRGCPQLDAAQQQELADLLAQPQRLLWLFSSGEAVGHLHSLAPAGVDWSRQRCLATHVRIAERARAEGWGHVVLTRPDAAAVAQAFSAVQADAYNHFHCE